MATLALPARPTAALLLAELLDRQRTLAVYGLSLLIVACIPLALQAVDPRTLANGINVWVKPAKFLTSIGIFALTAAWFFGYVRPERRRSWLMRGTASALILAGTVELAWIVWQAANGFESHFNNDTPFFSIMYSVMGLFAVILIGTTLTLAWEIGRRPAVGLPRDFTAAVVTGLLLTFLLGGILGGYMSAQAGHSVGAEGGHVPLFGWNRSGGDLRVAHFLGIHAEQAIPILAVLLAGLKAPARWQLLIAGTAAYAALTLAVFAQAVAGRPLL